MSDREKHAFFWFFNAFFECVCGANIWGTAKTTQLVSAARETNGSKIVSISDEAIGLLLIDNYFEKWHILAERDAEDTESAQEAETGTGREKRKRTQEDQESTLKKCLDIASMVGETALEFNSSMHCTSWLNRTGRVHRRNKWNRS